MRTWFFTEDAYPYLPDAESYESIRVNLPNMHFDPAIWHVAEPPNDFSLGRQGYREFGSWLDLKDAHGKRHRCVKTDHRN